MNFVAVNLLLIFFFVYTKRNFGFSWLKVWTAVVNLLYVLLELSVLCNT